MSLLSVGARALLANQTALQTTGHNIANVSTAGYSRQSVHLQTVQGQFSGSGYIGNGVNVVTIMRNHNELLTRQAAAAQAMSAGDSARAERVSQLQDVFQGGKAGLGAAISDMLNALGDVITAPTDITARTVSLTRMDEMAARMRSSAELLREIDYSVTEQLKTDTLRINQLAVNIAEMNQQISRVMGNGQTPNDLLDRRDQLIRELNQYIQTTQIPASDGTISVFVAGSQALVLGQDAAQLAVAESKEFPGSQRQALYFQRPGAPDVELRDTLLGGGQTAGLLRFANNDLIEGRNLLGRMALAIGAELNYQQSLGLTLDGTPGQPLFSAPASVAGRTSGAAVGSIDLGDPAKFDATKFAASDYEVVFNANGTDAHIIRLSDNTVKTVAATDLSPPGGVQMDGLTFEFITSGNPGERVLFQPFAGVADQLQMLIHSPRDLAVASPVNAAMGTQNTGTLQLAGLQADGLRWSAGPPAGIEKAGAINPPPSPVPPATSGGGVTLTFGPNGTFSVADATSSDVLNLDANPPGPQTPGAPPYEYQYVPGQTIHIDGWAITLQGTPKEGDTVVIGNATDPQYGDQYTRNAGNARAMQALRDVKMFDNASMVDGYAGLMAQVGTRTQSALYAAQMSEAIASDLEANRTAISGTNLDEEAARLIQYQQSYQASAKMLQVAQAIFDNLLQSVGR